MNQNLPLIAFVDGSIDYNKTESFSVGSYAAAFLRSRREPSSPEPVVDRLLVTAEFQEGYETVTNNRMELSAFLLVTSGLLLFDQTNVIVFSDSKWSLGALFDEKWSINKNRDLVNLVQSRIESSGFPITAQHVKGHRGSFLNNLVDYAALRSRLTKKTIDMDLPVHEGTNTRCLLCSNFPCGGGKRMNKHRWTDAFSYLKRNLYRVCDKFVAYASVNWTGSPGPRQGIHPL